MMELIAQLEPGRLLSTNIAPIRDRLTQLLERGAADTIRALRRIRIQPIEQRDLSSQHFLLVVQSLISRKRLSIDYYCRRKGEAVRKMSPRS